MRDGSTAALTTTATSQGKLRGKMVLVSCQLALNRFKKEKRFLLSLLPLTILVLHYLSSHFAKRDIDTPSVLSKRNTTPFKMAGSKHSESEGSLQTSGATGSHIVKGETSSHAFNMSNPSDYCAHSKMNLKVCVRMHKRTKETNCG